jgi:hypothetical protein
LGGFRGSDEEICGRGGGMMLTKDEISYLIRLILIDTNDGEEHKDEFELCNKLEKIYEEMERCEK